MATQTITGLTASQLTDGTYKVDFGFNAVDADNDLLGLGYEYKLTSASTWNAASTTGPASVTASGAGVAVAGVWDLDKDFYGNLQDASFDFRVTATKAATFATGSLTAVAANTTTGIKVGDTFTIGTEVYEFTITGTVTGDHIPVELSTATDAASVVKTKIIAAITAFSELVAATSGAGSLITLTALTAGTAGNLTITQSISNSATLTPVSLAGGLAAVPVTASVTVTGIDTGATDTVPGDVSALTTNKHDVEINVFEGTHTLKGFVAAGGFRWSRAKAAIEALRDGSETIFTIFSDRAIGEGVAVLVSPAIYADLVGSANVVTVEKPVQWLMNTAWRSFSQLFKGNNSDYTVYAIQESAFATKPDVGGVTVRNSTTVAYLVSYTGYIAMRN